MGEDFLRVYRDGGYFLMLQECGGPMCSGVMVIYEEGSLAVFLFFILT